MKYFPSRIKFGSCNYLHIYLCLYVIKVIMFFIYIFFVWVEGNKVSKYYSISVTYPLQF